MEYCVNVDLYFSKICLSYIKIDGFNIALFNMKTSFFVQAILPFSTTNNLTLYEYYCMELFRNGNIMWRFIGVHEYVLLINNYDCETGDFLVS